MYGPLSSSGLLPGGGVGLWISGGTRLRLRSASEEKEPGDFSFTPRASLCSSNTDMRRKMTGANNIAFDSWRKRGRQGEVIRQSQIKTEGEEKKGKPNKWANKFIETFVKN